MPKPIHVYKRGDLWIVDITHREWLSRLPFRTWQDAIWMTTILSARSRELSVIATPMATTLRMICAEGARV